MRDTATDVVVLRAMREEFSKVALHAGVAKFVEGARHEVGPALGAVLGAGGAKVLGIDPLAGAAAGYGIGATPDIVRALRERKAGITPAH